MTGRERTAINEALHELRRPLQALALCGGGSTGDVVASSTRLAAVALERLDREVNGGAVPRLREAVRCESLLRSAVGRWRARVALAGGSLELCWRADDATLCGERTALEQAVDNLIVNAIEHGGPRILVEGRRVRGRLLLSVADRGRGERSASRSLGSSRRPVPATAVARFTGRRRHGHGLVVVRRIAAAHGGRFALRRRQDGCVAVLDLPLAQGPAAPPDAAA